MKFSSFFVTHKILVLCLLGFFPLGNSFGQSLNADSVLQSFGNIELPSKVSALNDISRSYWNSSVDSALMYSNLAYELSKKHDFILEKTRALNSVGVVADLQGNYAEALNSYFRIIEIVTDRGYFRPLVPNSFFYCSQLIDSSKVIPDLKTTQSDISMEGPIQEGLELELKRMVANTYVNIAIVYGRLSQYHKSLVGLRQSLIIRESINDEQGMGVVLFNLGTVYVRLSQLDMAKKAYEQSIEIRERFDDKQGVSNGLLAMGQLYNSSQKYDSALFYLNQAKEAFHDLNNIRRVAQSITGIGEVYGKIEKPLEALGYLRRALVLHQNLNDREGVAQTHIYIAKVYTNLKDYINARRSYERGLNLARSIEHQALVAEALKGLVHVYEVQGLQQFAFDAFKEYHQQIISLNEQKYGNTLIEFQTLFQLDLISKENALLRKNFEINELELKKHKDIQLLLIILVIIVLPMGWALLILYRSIVRANRKLVNLNQELEIRVEEKTSDLRKALELAEESNNLKNAFLSNISHEIRTPLNGIMGFSSLISQEIDSDKDIERYIIEIKNSGNRLMHLLNNLIDFSRAESNNLRVKKSICSIPKAINDAIDINREEFENQKVSLEQSIDEKVPNIIADRDNLVRVFSIIINNAIKYSPQGKVTVSCKQSGDEGVISVTIADTGVGIDSDYLPHVFEPFRQESTGLSRSFQGAGLGLPLAKRLLELMGANLEVTSRKGFGTNVNIDFKQNLEKDSSTRKTQRVSKSERHPIAKAHKAKVLIVEENSYTRFYLQALLRKYVNVYVARDGSEALSILADSIAQNTLFDLIIVDSHLAEPWTPSTLLNEIYERKSDYKKRPFVIQTEETQDDSSIDRNLFVSYGYKQMVTKPIDKEKILTLLMEYSPKKNIN